MARLAFVAFFVTLMGVCLGCFNITLPDELATHDVKQIRSALSESDWDIVKGRIRLFITSNCRYSYEQMVKKDSSEDPGPATRTKNSGAYKKCISRMLYVMMVSSMGKCYPDPAKNNQVGIENWIDIPALSVNTNLVERQYNENRLKVLFSVLRQNRLSPSKIIPCHNVCMDAIIRPWYVANNAFFQGHRINFEENVCEGLPESGSCRDDI